MAYTDEPDEKLARVSEIPFATLVKLSFALAIGGAIFLFLFHMLAWMSGLPGPFLWFGSENRLSDVSSAAVGVSLATFFFSICGAAVLKFAALWHPLNFRFRIR